MSTKSIRIMTIVNPHPKMMTMMMTMSADLSLMLMNVDHLNLPITLPMLSIKTILLSVLSIKAILLLMSIIKTILLPMLSIPLPVLRLSIKMILLPMSSIKTILLPVMKLISKDISNPSLSANLSISRTGPSSHFRI